MYNKVVYSELLTTELYFHFSVQKSIYVNIANIIKGANSWLYLHKLNYISVFIYALIFLIVISVVFLAANIDAVTLCVMTTCNVIHLC